MRPTKWKFTSYERDSELRLDCAMHRYYGSGYGRFASVDLLAGHLPNPQSLNRYAYTLNDPINLVDPLGLDGDNVDAPWQCTGTVCNIGSVTSTVTVSGSPYLFGGGGGGRDDGAGNFFLLFVGGGKGSGGTTPNPKKDAVNRILQDGDCLDFILDLLQKAFNFANSQSSTPPSQAAIQEQQKAISPTNFANTLDSASLVPASNPNPNYGATAGDTSIAIHPGFYSPGADQAEMLIHETFHLAPFFFSDSYLASALNAPFAPGNTPQKTEENASMAWNTELNKHCGKKK
jgi:RHS repeat-associated protein